MWAKLGFCRVGVVCLGNVVTVAVSVFCEAAARGRGPEGVVHREESYTTDEATRPCLKQCSNLQRILV